WTLPDTLLLPCDQRNSSLKLTLKHEFNRILIICLWRREGLSNHDLICKMPKQITFVPSCTLPSFSLPIANIRTASLPAQAGSTFATLLAGVCDPGVGA